MFTGIVHSCSLILSSKKRQKVLEIQIKRPSDFQDLKVGDSISVDGICLTLEKFSSKDLTFALGQKTLEVTQWKEQDLLNKKVNLELSLKVGDRIGGDFITGHIDDMAEIQEVNKDNTKICVSLPEGYKKFIWKRGFIAINGVSLTIHEVKQNQVELHLIPETLKRTNLSDLSSGHKVTFEVSSLAKAFSNFFENSPFVQKG